MKTVGINHLGYPEVRNIQGLPIRNYKVQKQFDLFKIPDRIAFKLSGTTSEFYHNFHWSLTNKCDLYHLFNGISFNKKPWVSTYETFLPRLRKYDEYWKKHPEFWNKKGVKLMASDSCKRLIAISNNSQEIQKEILKEYYPEFLDDILPKMEVLHPQQLLKIEGWGEKAFADDKIHFTLASPDFFNKGGGEILRVMDRILEKRKDLFFHIISRIQFGDGHTHSTQEDQNEAFRIINKYPEHISRVDYLPNEELLELFKNSHVHFRTSYSDTYGFSVLEAQANGSPVISTDIRALGEINNSDLGYVIKVPKDKYGNGIIKTVEDRKRFSSILEEGLEDHITSILDHPERIKIRAGLCLNKIRVEHDPESRAIRLEEIYNSALS